MRSIPKLTKTNSIIGGTIITAGLIFYLGGCKKSTFDALVAELPFTKEKKEKREECSSNEGDKILDRDDDGGPGLPAGVTEKQIGATSTSSDKEDDQKPKVDYGKYENIDFEEIQDRTAIAHIIKVYKNTMDMHNSWNKNEKNVVGVAKRINKNFNKLHRTDIGIWTKNMMEIFKNHRNDSNIELVVYHIGMLRKDQNHEYHRATIHSVLAQHKFDSDTYKIGNLFLNSYIARENIK